MYYCLGWAYEYKNINLAIKYYNVAIDLFDSIKVLPEKEKVIKRLKKITDLEEENKEILKN